MGGRLFQAEGDSALWMFLAQLQQPFPQRFGRGVDGLTPALVVSVYDWVEEDVLFSRKA